MGILIFPPKCGTIESAEQGPSLAPAILCVKEEEQTMRIITNDRIFANALQVSLSRLGFDSTISTDLPARKSDLSGFVIDLDAVPADLPLPAPCITISRHPEKGPDLVRPFLFSTFSALALERFRTTPSPTPPVSSVVNEAAIELLPDSLLLYGKRIALTPSERALMALLMDAKGECVPTERIDLLWQGEGNTTAVYISYLRKKIQSVTDLQLIRSVRGKGYRLCLPR